MRLLPGVSGHAIVSPCDEYRYALMRRFGGRLTRPERGPVLFVMLNPSTAAATVDDWTLRRCQSFARAWGHSGVVVDPVPFDGLW